MHDFLRTAIDALGDELSGALEMAEIKHTEKRELCNRIKEERQRKRKKIAKINKEQKNRQRNTPKPLESHTQTHLAALVGQVRRIGQELFRVESDQPIIERVIHRMRGDKTELFQRRQRVLHLCVAFCEVYGAE